jgi:hypothetical protein
LSEGAGLDEDRCATPPAGPAVPQRRLPHRGPMHDKVVAETHAVSTAVSTYAVQVVLEQTSPFLALLAGRRRTPAERFSAQLNEEALRTLMQQLDDATREKRRTTIGRSSREDSASAIT